MNKKRVKKLNDDVKSDIEKLYLGGDSSVKISKVVGISQSIISKYINSLGLTRDRNCELYKNKELQDEVKKLYLEGMGSNTISKKLNIPNHNIKLFIRKQKIVRNRNIDKSLFKHFWCDNDKWYGYRECPSCGDKILCYAQKEYLLLRNIRYKTKKGCLCKKCYSEVYSGEKNKFYGRKHSEESIKKMLISQSKVIKPISKNEYVIYDILKSLLNGEDILTQFIIENKSYDFYVPKFNLIIEYNGDYWHCNPIKYGENYFNKKKQMSAKQIWLYDNNKLELCRKYNYVVETIWESDFLLDKNIVKKIIEKYDKTAN